MGDPNAHDQIPIASIQPHFPTSAHWQFSLCSSPKTFFPTKPFLPVYLLHLASFEEEPDPVCCLLAPCQYHDTCGLFVQPMTQVQGFRSHVFQHLGQNWQHISDTVLDSRATCITHRQQGNKGRYSHPHLA